MREGGPGFQKHIVGGRFFYVHIRGGFITAFNFISVKNGLLELTKSVSRIGSFPPDIFKENARIILYSIFPIALIAAVPTKLLTLDYSWTMVVYTWMVAAISLTIAVLFWKRAIRSYTSSGG